MNGVRRPSRASRIARLVGCSLFGALCAALSFDGGATPAVGLLLGAAGVVLAYVVRFGPMGAVGMVIGVFSGVGYVNTLGGAFTSLSANLAVAAAIAALGGALTVVMMVAPSKSGRPSPPTTGVQKLKAAAAAVLGSFVVYSTGDARGDVYQRGPPVISALDSQQQARHPNAIVAAKKVPACNRAITDDRYRGASFSARNGHGYVDLVYTPTRGRAANAGLFVLRFHAQPKRLHKHPAGRRRRRRRAYVSGHLARSHASTARVLASGRLK